MTSAPNRRTWSFPAAVLAGQEGLGRPTLIAGDRSTLLSYGYSVMGSRSCPTWTSEISANDVSVARKTETTVMRAIPIM